MLSKKEGIILKKIEASIKSDSMPRFPISKTKKIVVPDFDNVRVKDESSNKTGTHKDRMAREIVMVYLDILKNKQQKQNKFRLPHFSVISAGSAALAIQTQLRYYGLPNLKILVDKTTDRKMLATLKKIGCEIYKTDLDKKQLNPQDILRLTKNPDGFDITSNKGLDPTLRFYDWLAYEILNQNPDYVFCPFGTGQLFENILNIAKLILTSKDLDAVYRGDRNKIKNINFIGATTNNKDSKAIKLYAPFRPFTSINSERLKLYAAKGYCGDQSQILEVKEKFIDLGFYLLQKNKISAEYSGAAGIGLLYQIKNKIPPHSKILIVNTGQAKI